MKEYFKIIIYICIAFGIGFIVNTIIQTDSKSQEKIDLVVLKNDIQVQEDTSIILQDIDESIISEDTKSDTTEKEVVKKPEVKFVCKKPTKEYADMFSLNIGQSISLIDPSYVPKNLELLESTLATRSDICLEKNTKQALKKMSEDAKKDGLTIKVTSGFRSYITQKSILDEVSKTKSDANRFVAKPGYSEHQLGTTADISGKSIDYGSADRSFGGSIESVWLKVNAYKYGFVLSYPFGKEEITGYAYEPWHYRYLGVENATYIFENDLTITEFLSLPEEPESETKQESNLKTESGSES